LATAARSSAEVEGTCRLVGASACTLADCEGTLAATLPFLVEFDAPASGVLRSQAESVSRQISAYTLEHSVFKVPNPNL
jgi:hypothetical protein